MFFASSVVCNYLVDAYDRNDFLPHGYSRAKTGTTRLMVLRARVFAASVPNTENVHSMAISAPVYVCVE
jgi:hypothetical protein